MYILAVDQAKNGAWCIYDYESKVPVDYGAFSISSESFEDVILGVSDTIDQVILENDITAIFIEDVQLRANPDSFKKLSQLQGALIYNFKKHDYLFDIVSPSTWQNYCNARGRTSKEIKAGANQIETEGSNRKKASKVLSIQFVRDNFGINTDNDNIADSICIGFWAVNNVRIQTKSE